jgi:two-component system, OmpR family, alkaline phosphatase synthesis response regulator PhoP
MKVLLIEDEDNIRKLMKLNLELESYTVVEAADGEKAMERFNTESFDLIVLDLMLPNVNGLDICQKIRFLDKKVKIIIVSAKDHVQDRIMGLKLGADDYLTKPFDLEEFLLRVKNLAKRDFANESALDIFTFGVNTIYFSEYKAITKNGEFSLTPKEVLFLKMLIERSNSVVTRNQILQTVWGYDVYPSTRTIDNFILAFRKYFESNTKDPVHFHTIRGIGYKFTP